MDTAETTKRPANRTQRRRNHIINPGFQWRYTLLISGSVFFVSTFMSVVLFGVLREQARSRFLVPQATHIWENTLVMILSAIAFSLVTAGAVGFWSVFFTHRIAGPMFVLENYFRQMMAGRLPSVRSLRKKDEFKELHNTFRKAVDAVRTRERMNLDALTDTLRLARSIETEDVRGMKDALDNVVHRVEGLRLRVAETLGEQPELVPSTPEQHPQAASDAERPPAEVHA